MAEGDTITEDSVRSVRPGFGLAPKYLANIIGKKVTRNVNANTAITGDTVEGFFE